MERLLDLSDCDSPVIHTENIQEVRELQNCDVINGKNDIDTSAALLDSENISRKLVEESKATIGTENINLSPSHETCAVGVLLDLSEPMLKSCDSNVGSNSSERESSLICDKDTNGVDRTYGQNGCETGEIPTEENKLSPKVCQSPKLSRTSCDDQDQSKENHNPLFGKKCSQGALLICSKVIEFMRNYGYGHDG